MECEEILGESTLPEGAWKDSFDKLLNQRSILRKKNVIKKYVRASLNMNSSWENSNLDKSQSSLINCSQTPIMQHLHASRKCGGVITLNGIKTISTPISKSNPFRCTLSPIGLWELPILDKLRKCGKVEANVLFNSTPLNENDIFEGRSERLPLKYSKEHRMPSCTSPLTLIMARKLQKSRKILSGSHGHQNKSDDDVNKIQPYSSQLKPGKWRKSLYIWRRTVGKFIDVTTENKSFNLDERHQVVGQRKSLMIKLKSKKYNRKTTKFVQNVIPGDHKSQILQLCQQNEILPFEAVYNGDYIETCRKIGEGAFGEVFLQANSKNVIGIGATVLKIIPIEGKMLVNNETQKTFEQILPEIIITKQLSNLSDDNSNNVTKGFVNLLKVRCVSGEYPLGFIKLWEEYNNLKESENDHPSLFVNSQQYIVLELAYSGKDLESFVFNNAEESYHVIEQVILTLAVGEKAYQFEHRDLHWGNVLVQRTDQKYISYNLFGKQLTIPTKGIHMKIIDYTLSRLTYNNCCYYNDLSNDEDLFNAVGDYQFDIYRMMRDELKNQWERFEPKTNIFWVAYIIGKLLHDISYKNSHSKLHSQYMRKLKDLNEKIFSYKSCMECARKVFKFP